MNVNEFISSVDHSANQYIKTLLNPDKAKTKYEFRFNTNYETILFCNVAIIRIKSKKKEPTLELKIEDLKFYGLKDQVKLKTSDLLWATASFNNEILTKILGNINKVFERCYLSEAVEPFGCCSRYEECSDKKTCIHPDIKLASGCYYKTNLEDGRIFYGKNRNIDIE